MTESYKGIKELFYPSRRSFLAGATAMGAATMLSGMATRAMAQTPKRGGVLRLGIGAGSTTDSIDPGILDNHFTHNVVYAIYNYLGEVDENGVLIPELAESWEGSENARKWVFKIRDGISFHDGKALTPDDVVASINYHRGEESTSAAKLLLTSITDIAVDGRNVVVTLSGGNADFPSIASDYHLAIMPSDGGKVDPLKGIGTGGYVLRAFEPGVSARLERNPNYFKTDRAHFDEVHILAIPDSVARTNALITGEIDVMNAVDVSTVHLLERRSDLSVMETTGTLQYTFPMRTDTAPFSDNNVRMALKHAIDREKIVDSILSGHGVVGNDQPISAAYRFFDPSIEQRTYDPDKAKFYLKEAGLEKLSVDLHSADQVFTGSLDAAVLFQEHARLAGIDINVVREPDDGYWSNVWMKKPWSTAYWTGPALEDWIFTSAYSAGADWNDTFWNSERFNELLLAARAELDTDKRREMYSEMQLLVRDTGGVVIPAFANDVFASSAKIAHGPLASNWPLDGNKCIERWWFA